MSSHSHRKTTTRREVRALLIVFVVSFCIGSITVIANRVYNSRYHIRNEATLALPERSIRVQLADTATEHKQGLSDKKSIADDEGMLFVFSEEGRYSFWMKGMLFPIDMVWLSEEGLVVHKEEDVATSTYPKAFVSASDAKYVLELPSGGAGKAGLYLGTQVPDVTRFEAKK